QLLAELAAAWQQRTGQPVAFESVGGVDAAKRVAAGEAFDLVVLAADAIDKLIAGGHALAGSRTEIVLSSVAIAVRAGAQEPDVASEDALRAAVLAAPTIGYSTGPSGTALLQLFERWGITGQVRDKLRQARPGVPVGSMVASGDVALGFQRARQPFADGQPRIRHRLAERACQWHGEHPRHAARQPDRDPAGDAAAQTSQVVAGALHLVQDAAPVLEQHLARFGGHGTAAVAHQQGLAQLDLQQPHLPAEGRLGHLQLGGGAGETAQLGHADEVLELAEVHARSVVSSLSYSGLF
ncbi:MAG: hypothetical protein EOO24_57030, partial [Comamonadaceae bacterium]